MKKILFIIILLSLVITTTSCQSEDSSANTFTAKDLLFLIDEESYHTGMNINTVFENLGREYSYSEGLSCDYDGLDKTYTYDNIEFYTFPQPEGDIVNEIYSKSPSVVTTRGISVGATKEAVLTAYGTSFSDLSFLLVYQIAPTTSKPNGESLCFEMDNDIVVAIFLTTQPV